MGQEQKKVHTLVLLGVFFPSETISLRQTYGIKKGKLAAVVR